MANQTNRRYIRYTLSDYDITMDGQVINKHTGKALKLQPNGKGYLRFGLHTENGRRMFFVHRIVAEMYIPNPENKPQVNHIDGNKQNNNVNNLEWVTNIENRKHAIANDLHTMGEKCSWSKLTWRKVNYIRNHPEISREVLAKRYNVTKGTIDDVRKFKSWKTIEKIC